MPLPLALIGIGAKILGGGLQAAFSGVKNKQKAADASIEATKTYKASPFETANLQAAQARTGAPMPGEAEAKMNIGQSTTQALGAAKTRKGGLASVGSIQAGANKAQQELSVKKAGFKLGAERDLSNARGRMTGEYGKEFQSEQDKQSLKTQVALGALAGAKASKAQGLAMLGSGAGDLTYSQNDVGAIFNKKTKAPGLSRTNYEPEMESYGTRAAGGVIK